MGQFAREPWLAVTRGHELVLLTHRQSPVHHLPVEAPPWPLRGGALFFGWARPTKKAPGQETGANQGVMSPPVQGSLTVQAVDRADQIKGILTELAGSGMTTPRIAQELTARGITTPLGGRWHPQTVKRVMERVSL